MVDVFRDGDVVLVAVLGELDMATVERLDTAMSEISATDRITVDCTGLTFVDSVGPAAFARVAVIVRDNGGFVLRHPRRSFVKLLEVTGLAELIAVDTPLADDEHHLVAPAAPAPSQLPVPRPDHQRWVVRLARLRPA